MLHKIGGTIDNVVYAQIKSNKVFQTSLLSVEISLLGVERPLYMMGLFHVTIYLFIYFKEMYLCKT